MVVFLAAHVALACGDDEDEGSGSGASAGKGGSAGTGGSANKVGGEGGALDGAGGAPNAVSCTPPAPPSDGEGGSGGAGASEGLAIVGTYTDDFESEHVITSATWSTEDSVYYISQFDNAEGYVIALNAQDNEYSPCGWSRFDWTESDGELYFCQSAFGADSEEAALETKPADAKNLDMGCSGFPWSRLSPS